nr:hypothetical protein CFP56_12918 [Quercus suber]
MPFRWVPLASIDAIQASPDGPLDMWHSTEKCSHHKGAVHKVVYSREAISSRVYTSPGPVTGDSIVFRLISTAGRAGDAEIHGYTREPCKPAAVNQAGAKVHEPYLGGSTDQHVFGGPLTIFALSPPFDSDRHHRQAAHIVS